MVINYHSILTFKKTINSFKINVIVTTIQCFALNKVSKAKKKDYITRMKKYNTVRYRSYITETNCKRYDRMIIISSLKIKMKSMHLTRKVD